MKAAILHAPGEPLTIEEVAVDSPGPREVLIRTAACGVCRSDLHFIDGKYPHPLPVVPGHEAAGIVEAVGSDIFSIRPGDHVVTCLSAYCGRCEFCVTGRIALCTDPSTRRAPEAPPRYTIDGAPVHQLLNVSGYAEQMLVHENAAVAIHPDMPLDRAALLGCAVVTGAGAVFNSANVRPGEHVAVVGCGGIGLAAINAAKIAGAARIVAIDPVAEKRDLALTLGATDAFDPASEDLAKQVVALTGGGVHHAIEAVGRIETGQLCVALLRRGGTATMLGMMPLDGQRIGLNAMELLSEKKVQGALMGSNRFPLDIPRLVDFYMAGKLDLETIIAERIALDRINEAMDALRQGDSVRSVVVFE
ncbi:MAG: Zn-dependent alcohol dehydrogenase [Sphingomonadaceae bacterium]|nr:Zn-dependent alcohol dehydrogenase [Sphingomonadaceae bacterium]